MIGVCLQLMTLLSRGGGVSDIAGGVHCSPEDGQSTAKVEERTNLEDLGHGQCVDAEQDGAHGKVHGHAQESHDTCAVLLRDCLGAEGADRREVQSSGHLEQQERENGVGGLYIIFFFF